MCIACRVQVPRTEFKHVVMIGYQSTGWLTLCLAGQMTGANVTTGSYGALDIPVEFSCPAQLLRLAFGHR